MSTPVNDTRGYYIGLAFFTTGLYLALLVAGFGFLSLLLDIEVIDEADAGPVVGPFMSAIACAVLLLCLGAIGKRLSVSAAIIPVGRSLLVGLACGVAWVLAGAVSYSINGEASEGFVEFALHNAVRPFVLVVIIAAAVLALVYSLLVVRRVHGSHRPAWPWERDDDSIN